MPFCCKFVATLLAAHFVREASGSKEDLAEYLPRVPVVSQGVSLQPTQQTLHCITLYCTVLQFIYIELCRTALHCNALHCTALQCLL